MERMGRERRGRVRKGRESRGRVLEVKKLSWNALLGIVFLPLETKVFTKSYILLYTRDFGKYR